MSLLAGVMDVLGLAYEVSVTNLTNHIGQFQLVYDTSQQ